MQVCLAAGVAMFRIFAVLISYLTPFPKLDDCVQYWQDQMQLNHWRIELQVVAVDQLDDPLNLGDIEPHESTHTATLRILREQDLVLPKHLALAEQRLTIIHEMVHLRKFAYRDGNWRSEVETNMEAGEWVRRHRRWREALAIER
jgi:hypothetical protein